MEVGETEARPLHGLKVLELGSNVSAPYAALQLAEYGADVIKIEPPEGDATRRMGPTDEPGMSPLFLGMNRGKKSVVLNLKTPAGRAALDALLADADVFIHNVRPHKLKRLGLGPDSLCAVHPRLVYAGIHGFHETGPYGRAPAYDDIIQGLSGMASLAQRQGGDPRYVPAAVADKTTANIAVQAILAALYARQRSGRGAYVEVPMFETTVSYVLAEHMHAHHFLPTRGAAGYTRLLSGNRKPFQTADGHLCLMPATDAHWRRFFEATGQAGLADDPRFVSLGARTQHIEALYEIVEHTIRRKTTDEWLSLLQQIDVPAARMNQLEDLPRDPHLAATGHFVTMQDAGLGMLRFPRSGVRFDGRPSVAGLAPRLGEHTRQALRAAGMPQAELDALLASEAAREDG